MGKPLIQESTMIGRAEMSLSLAMATVLLAGALLGPAAGIRAGENPPPTGSPAARPAAQFLIRMRPAHPDSPASAEDKARIVQHFDYWKDLHSRGKLILAGMATDDYSEIAILQVEDSLEAERLATGDPAVRGNVYLAEVHPFRLTLAGDRR